MKILHAVALTVCALAPTGWIVVIVALLVAHDGSLLRWSDDDWLRLALVVVGPLALAAVLLRIPAPHLPRALRYRTTAMLNAGVPSEPMISSQNGR